eukprot:363309-Chlamydomonas_euryale.AAC.32
MSWVHRDDLVALIGAAIADTRYRGAYNATAPQPVRMSEFCSALGAAMGRPSWLPAPEPALKAVLGEGAVVVLEGQKVRWCGAWTGRGAPLRRSRGGRRGCMGGSVQATARVCGHTHAIKADLHQERTYFLSGRLA